MQVFASGQGRRRRCNDSVRESCDFPSNKLNRPFRPQCWRTAPGPRESLCVPFMVLLAASVTRATDVVTYHNDNFRTGQNLVETILTPSNVNSKKFAKLFTISVDGVIDAQPLYLSSISIPGQGIHNVLYVVTENDSVYAFDADTGTRLWHVSVLASGEKPSDIISSCVQIAPEIGITATPVIDRSSGPNGTIYVVAMSKNSSGKYYQRLHALSVATGAEEFKGPVTVQATYPGSGDNSHNGHVIFDPVQYAERAGLLLLNHVVYTGWTSHCDTRPYTGWLIGYSESTLAQTSVLNLTPNGSEGSIWQSGAGMAAGVDIFFLDANGTFDTTLNSRGFPSRGDYGNAFLKISTINNKLAVADYFAMYNTVSESDADQDLGSGGALLVPPLKDASGNVWNLAIGGGKDGNIYIVNRSNMGKFNPHNNSAIYQEIVGALGGGMWSMPAYFNGNVYFGPQGNNLLQFRFSQARLSTSPVLKTTTNFEYPGSTPSVSANGTNDGIVWAIEHSSPSVLHAYNANNISHELYNSNQASGGRDTLGYASHFGTPTIVNGKVYVGTVSGVTVYGLLP
jgi:outer membrane protein assembly factor BamB